MSTTAASKRSAESVRKLYRSLLKIGRKWPTPVDRRDRSMWEAIPRVTRTKFSLLKQNLTPAQIKEHGEYGVKELNSIRRIINDTHKQEYPLKGNYAAAFNSLSKNKMDDELLILSSEYQSKEQGKYWGGDMKLLNKLFHEKEETIPKKSTTPANSTESQKPL